MKSTLYLLFIIMISVNWLSDPESINTSTMLEHDISSSFAAQEAPRITRIERLGRIKLLVVGRNFTERATVLIGGKQLKTSDGEHNPPSFLIAKKVRKKLLRQEIVMLQVRNPDGMLSSEFPFYTGPTVSVGDGVIKVKVGERFLLYLSDADSSMVWQVTIFDLNLVRRVDFEPEIPGSQGIFQAERAGETMILAEGSFPCPTPPLPCPPGQVRRIEVRVVVK